MPGEHNKGEIKKHLPRTLRQICSMCKSYPVNATYGNKIIETVVKSRIYDNEKKHIYLSAPINSQKYSFILCFSDENTYRDIRDEIYSNKDKIIVVAGKWEAAGIYNYFTTKVNGRKQVVVIKK